QTSQINPARFRELLLKYVPAPLLLLKSHFKNDSIRNQINKFCDLAHSIPPSIIVHFAVIIQPPSSNPYDDLKVSIFQQTRPSAADRIQMLFERECVREEAACS
ncbi:unnamed protein product, partial [Hymenolepis diminuta]